MSSDSSAMKNLYTKVVYPLFAAIVYLASHIMSIALLFLMISSLFNLQPSRKFGPGGDPTIVVILTIILVELGGILLQVVLALKRNLFGERYSLHAAAQVPGLWLWNRIEDRQRGN